MDATQFSTLISHIDAAGVMVGGFLLAAIFAVTWKG